jgi:glucose-1-phosphate thymidylyltransferase
VIWLKEVEDPSRFGVAVHVGDTITEFVEKPSEPISNQAIIGVYYFKEGAALAEEIQYLIDNNVTGHGSEYQLTDALDRLLQKGKQFKKATVDEWLDCGTLPAWLDTTFVILEKENGALQADPALYPGSTLHPPVYIGEGVQILNSEVGPFVSIENGSVIEGSKISRSILRDHAIVKDSELQESTIGSYATVRELKGKLHIGDHSEVEG